MTIDVHLQVPIRHGGLSTFFVMMRDSQPLECARDCVDKWLVLIYLRSGSARPVRMPRIQVDCVAAGGSKWQQGLLVYTYS